MKVLGFALALLALTGGSALACNAVDFYSNCNPPTPTCSVVGTPTGQILMCQ